MRPTLKKLLKVLSFAPSVLTALCGVLHYAVGVALVVNGVLGIEFIFLGLITLALVLGLACAMWFDVRL